MYAAVLLIALALFGVGLRYAVAGQGFTLVAAGGISLVAVLVAWPICMVLTDIARSGIQKQNEIASILTERLQQISVMLNLISEQQLLSDRAKGVAFREKDRDALRRAIQEEISRHDFEAATALANDIESVFGLRQEAQALRDQIEATRQDQVNRQITDAVALIDRHIRGEAWPEAMAEAERVARDLPNSDVAQKIPHEVSLRREAHKKHLIDSLNDAEGRSDYDAAIEIIKKLDTYLTPNEAEQLQEQVRGIFKQKLQALANQFKSAYADNPKEAIHIGEQITRDFPNTRIAQEIAEKLPDLRHRASAPPVPTPA